MEQKTNKYIAVAYQLYTLENGKSELVEEATEEQPFLFITGFGFALEDFEKQIEGLEQGGEFDFTLTKSQAYGDYDAERVVDLEREIFTIILCLLSIYQASFRRANRSGEFHDRGHIIIRKKSFSRIDIFLAEPSAPFCPGANSMQMTVARERSGVLY